MLKVCTFNVNSIRARLDLVLRWLEKRGNDIDILCLQELKVTEDLFPFQSFEELGYHCNVWGQKSYNGVAILSKTEASEVVKGFGNSPLDEQKRFIRCQIGDITVLCLYVPHGDSQGKEKYEYKQEWYRFFLNYLKENFSPQKPLLVVGDLNVALSDQDVFDPVLLQDSIGTMPEERQALKGLLDWGLVDTYRHLHPDTPGFTWWSYMGGDFWKDRGMRIDYILCTQPLADKVANVEIDIWPRRRRKPTPSDHAPVVVELKT